MMDQVQPFKSTNLKSILREAKRCRTQGDVAGAEVLLRRAWQLHRGNRNAALQLARHLIAEDSGNEAEEILRTAIAQAADADLLVLLGEQRLKCGHDTEAEALLRRAWSLDRGHGGTSKVLAGLLIAKGCDSEAEEILRFSIACTPDPGLLRRLADNKWKQGDVVEAEALLRRAWSLDPGRGDLGNSLAKVLIQIGRFDEAEEVLRHALARAPDLGLLRRLADSKWKQGDFVEAEELLREAWSLDPGRGDVCDALARVLIQIGRFDEAEEVLRISIARAPDPGLLRRLADSKWKRGDVVEAEALLREAWSLDPGRGDVGNLLARALIHFGRGDEAEEVLRHALARAPDARVLRRLAEQRLKQGDLLESEALLRHATSLDPRHSGGIRSLSKVLHAAGRRDECLSILEEALTVAPDDPMFLLELGKLYSSEDRPVEARQLFVRATEIQGSPVNSWVQLANLTARLESSKASIACLRRGLGVVGRDATLEGALAERLVRYGLIADAKKVLAKALELFPDNIRLLRCAVGIDILSGEHSPALDTLRSIYREDSNLRGDVFLYSALKLKSEWNIYGARKILRRLVNDESAKVRDFVVLADTYLLDMDIVSCKSALRSAEALKEVGKRRNISQSLTGELVNDYSIDRVAYSAARIVWQSRSVDSYLDTIREFRGYLGCSIPFFVCLRQNGKLETKSPSRPGSFIRKSIYQYWDTEDIPEDVADLVHSWSSFNKDWRHQLFSNRSAEQYLGRRPDQSAYRAFRRAPSAAGRADILRLALLFDLGGVYVDADDRCLMPLNPILDGREIVVRQEPMGSIGNNFIAVRAGHPVIGQALADAVTSYLRGDRDSIWLSSGPGLLSRTLANYLVDDPARLDELGQTIVVADLHEVRRFCISGCEAAYKKSKRNWQKAEFQDASVLEAAWAQRGSDQLGLKDRAIFAHNKP